MNARAFRKWLDSIPDGWVRLFEMHQGRARLRLGFIASSGQRGKEALRFSVQCSGVREYHLGSLDGGGIRVDGPSHPAARQHWCERCRLTVGPCPDARQALGALVSAHTMLVQDWVPIDRYLGSLDSLVARLESGTKAIISGPTFLMKVYQRSLRHIGVQSRVSSSRPARNAPKPRVLHFSDSFVVGDGFVFEASS